MIRPDPNLFSASTHFPERRANLYAEALAARLAEIRAHAEAVAAMPGALSISPEVVEDLVARHIGATRALWAAEGRCASWFIVGPANFPVELNRKRLETADRRRNEVLAHLAAAKRRLEKVAFPHGMGDAIRSADPEAVEKLQERLAAKQAWHAHALVGNKLIRKHGVEARPHMEEAGIPEDMIRSGLKLMSGGKPWGFFTSNSAAEIKRLKDRIAQLERMKARGTVEQEFSGGVRMVENAEAARVQLFFPGKPEADVRSVLKANGFRWAPSEGAWQRHLNGGGRWAAERVIKALGLEISQPQPEPQNPPADPEPVIGQRWKGNGPIVTAIFASVDVANAYMEQNPGQGVLTVWQDKAVLADINDLGI